MWRSTLIGAAVFGLLGFVAGYIWTAFEFPFILGVQWFGGWAVVTWPLYGRRTAGWAALAGGLTFTAAFMVAMFLAIADDSPLPLAGWLATTLAAGIAGAVTGYVLDRGRGATVLGLLAGLGMLVGTMLSSALRQVAPGAVDVAGPAQYLYVATAQALVGVATGAAIGAGVAYLRRGAGRVRRTG